MNYRESQSRPLCELYWSGTVLNVYTIGLMLISPFWAGFLLRDEKYFTLCLMSVLLAALITLSLIEKPLLAFDPASKTLISPDGDRLSLENIDIIEMDTRDIYVIPKSQHIEGWHLAQRGWVLTPRRALMAMAKDHNLPIRDISHPFTRFGFWIAP